MKSLALKSSILKTLKMPVIISGIFITVLTLTVYIFKPDFIKLIDNKLYDLTLSTAFKNRLSDFASVIVDIDEYSLSQFGQWPWPRYHFADLIEKIDQSGAAAIGIDILFAEHDRTSPVVIKKALKENFNVELNISNLSDEIRDNDILLAKALSKSSSVLGYYFSFKDQENIKFPSLDNKITIPALDANIEFPPNTDFSVLYPHIFNADGAILPIYKNQYSGFMNTLSDNDGVLRRTPLFIAWKDKIYPQLALAALLNFFYKKQVDGNSKQVDGNSNNNNKINLTNPVIKLSPNGVESLTIESPKPGSVITIPLEINGSMMLNYRGPSHTFKYISAAKIIQNNFNKEELKDKIVFIGSSAAGLKDIRLTPFDLNFPGVEVHATIVDNILKSDFIIKPNWSFTLEFIITLFCSITSLFLIAKSGAWISLILTLIMSIAIFISGVWTLKTYHIWISMLFPLFALYSNFTLLNLIKYAVSEREKQFYRTAFGHYVSKSVVNQIIESPEKCSLDGEEKEITILFSDIRNFSSISENLSPSQVSRLLHDYFTPVTHIIIEHQGTLDKFIGDAVMCFWNAPLAVEGHKALALNAAINIMNTLENLSLKFEKDYGVTIKTGIGLHSGVCRVGNMGSDDLFDYTAIGDHVNLASRLEGLTKFYGVNIIFSENIIHKQQGGMLKDKPLIMYVDRVRVKGKSEPINIYTPYLLYRSNKNLLNKDNGSDDFIEIVESDQYKSAFSELEQYNYAVELYKKREFKEAFNIFSLLYEKLPSSPFTKIYSIYKDRAFNFINEPPDLGWDGIYNHETK